MIDPIDKKTQELNRGRDYNSGRKMPRESPHTKPDSRRKEPFCYKEFQVPGPGSPVCNYWNEMEGVSETGLSLAQQRRPTRVIPVPKREFPVVKQRPVLDHRQRQV